ncbi:preprotein translocase subunit SecA [Ruminococcus sp. zg-924]|uniref:preprotein translocase subunit SecA n=1 Tax=unclassified Ruminococcus TaxID=2608920 RepID=UPI0033705952|nr:preprotein translocase subunit SecA [Ruminococcus sp. zg-924]MCQ4113861.1 preprotein translocase subunit SecA [Ruminococcus sp. zg-921]
MANFLKAMFGNYSKREVKRVKPLCDKVLELESKYQPMSDKELKEQTSILKERLKNGETTDDILTDAFAVCREASYRVLGMKHFPVQIIGGIILHQGRIAEMKTGEGKTLVATLPAYLNGLTGEGVHIVTVNDYLARRDSEWMGKLYRWLGLSVGLIVHDLANDLRKKAYAADITYGTNNELGFDYLRDNMVVYKDRKVQRGHAFAVVDEVDSILIDEARTPLIISGQGDKSTDLYERADALARTMKCKKFAEIDSKEDNDDYYKEHGIEYIVDEKAKSATLTPLGVKRAESYFGIENLTDPDNLTIQHHVNQAIKAYGIMQKDIDYVVKDNEVIIVDEFTGRLMYGRRYNEGLHQAIEAKEGVKIANESKTLATITFQNYFRLYKKLSGMTGTAMTEEEEFREIYKLDVVEIPTNKPVAREDLPDAIFKTEEGKFNAVINDIIECHEKGQPVLVGTISIEKSEHLSAMLKRRGIKHNVLNAKHHEKEAEIVAQAGKKGAVTIATNMAGRGTDIILGGNAEYLAKAEMRRMQMPEEIIAESTAFGDTDDEEILEARRIFAELNAKYKNEIKDEAEEVRAAGGLFIMGTERHESRRIDNQLRGRSGRQGDPGKSRFYLSTEDDLMRLFGGERMKAIMERLNAPDDVPLENKMLSNIIESSQQKVESRNFAIRKNVLQYDDVMNRQREIIYAQRDQVLDGENIKDQIVKMIEQTIESTVKSFCPEDVSHDMWNLESLRDYYLGWLIDETEMKYSADELEGLEQIDLIRDLNDKATELYKGNEEILPEETMREMERVYLLKNVDTYWMDHIDAMEQLKQGIRLRAYGQRDPVVEYRFEGFDMFDQMIATIRENTVKMVLVAPRRILAIQKQQAEMQRLAMEQRAKAEAAAKQAQARQAAVQEQARQAAAQTQQNQKLNVVFKREQVAKPTATSGDGTDSANKTVRKTAKQKVGRNDPCPCGSGKKYKKCCGRDE